MFHHTLHTTTQPHKNPSDMFQSHKNPSDMFQSHKNPLDMSQSHKNPLDMSQSHKNPSDMFQSHKKEPDISHNQLRPQPTVVSFVINKSLEFTNASIRIWKMFYNFCYVFKRSEKATHVLKLIKLFLKGGL